jgi:GNAT superfamily N-acetyltransferase
VFDIDLIEKACETNAHYLALGNEQFQAHGATFIRNRSTPSRYDANRVVLVRTDDAAELVDLLNRLEVEFDGFAHRGLEVDALTPPQLEAALVHAGYSVSEYLVLALEGDLHATAKPFDIREVLTDADWETYRALDELASQAWDPAFPAPDQATLGDFLRSKRLKSPPARVWLAFVADVACAYLSSWPGDNGVGIVEDLFTHPDYRHRGIATALIAHCVEDARNRGARPVIINADPKDTPKQMYSAMGFRPLYITRSYWRNLRPTS